MAKTDSPIQLVVCDAGPIIHLDELGCLTLLADFAEVLIPAVVWDEVQKHRPAALTLCKQLARSVQPTQAIASDLEAVIRLFSLHAGEIQALQVAREQQANLLLSDDTAARMAAQAVGMTVHGTLGILLRAIRRGQKSQAEVLAVLRAIPNQSSLHIKPALLQDVIAQVEQYTADSA